jgi:D-beta-D-heptose 7-phosphate kinase/D-beta-D-heptose 1-phosphate adenosyltransferase
MEEDERLIIISSIKYVNKSIISIDKDKTQCATLVSLAEEFSTNYDLYFANGGDQNNDSIPEVKVCKENNIGLIEGLGDKIQSSSWILKK